MSNICVKCDYYLTNSLKIKMWRNKNVEKYAFRLLSMI